MFFKKKKDYAMYEADAYYDDSDYIYNSDNISSEDTKTIENSVLKLSYEKRPSLITTKVTVVVILYIVFLAIGIFSTSFFTNELGIKEAQIVTVTLREERESYYLLRKQYFIIKELLNEIQKIDNKLGETDENQYFVYATEYDNLLTGIDDNLTLAKGLAVDPKYRILQAQIVELYQQDISIYLQKMGIALSKKDAVILEEALSWRDQMFSDFEQLEKNMVTFAKVVKLEDKQLYDDLSY